MSPEERVAAIRIAVVESQPNEQMVAEIAEPFKESATESGDFDFIMSDTAQTGDLVAASESNDMIFMLSEPDNQTADNSLDEEASGFLLSYQGQTADAPSETTSFSDFAAEAQKIQPAFMADQYTPVANIEEPAAPVVDIFREETQHDFFATSDPVPQPPVAMPPAQQDFFVPDETSASAESVTDDTRTLAARTTDKQSVRITVREETAGSVTLSVADILGEDDFDEEQNESVQQVDKLYEPVPAIEPQQAEVSASQPEIISSESEPPSVSGPLKITDYLFTLVTNTDVVEEVSGDETPVTQTLNSAPETSSASEETMTAADFPKATASLSQPGRDSGKVEEMLKVSRPLKITGFLNDFYESDASEPVNIICPGCGHISKATDLLCLECGAFFEEPETETQNELTCVDCGENVAADEVFCPACGSILLAH